MPSLDLPQAAASLLAQRASPTFAREVHLRWVTLAAVDQRSTSAQQAAQAYSPPQHRASLPGQSVALYRTPPVLELEQALWQAAPPCAHLSGTYPPPRSEDPHAPCAKVVPGPTLPLEGSLRGLYRRH